MTNLKRDSVLPENSFAEKISYAFTHMGSLKERPAARMEQVFRKLFTACEIKQLSEEEQSQYKTDMTTKMDWENILYTAELRGTERGMEKGIKKGIKKGIEEGIEKGAREALVATARRMVQQLGYTTEQAAEATGLKPEQFLD